MYEVRRWSLYIEVGMTVILCELSEMPRNRQQECIKTVHAKTWDQRRSPRFGRTWVGPSWPSLQSVDSLDLPLSISRSFGLIYWCLDEVHNPSLYGWIIRLTLVWFSSQHHGLSSAYKHTLALVEYMTLSTYHYVGCFTIWFLCRCWRYRIGI